MNIFLLASNRSFRLGDLRQLRVNELASKQEINEFAFNRSSKQQLVIPTFRESFRFSRVRLGAQFTKKNDQ